MGDVFHIEDDSDLFQSMLKNLDAAEHSTVSSGDLLLERNADGSVDVYRLARTIEVERGPS